jgi:P-type conjugative transfer protein TrbG
MSNQNHGRPTDELEGAKQMMSIGQVMCRVFVLAVSTALLGGWAVQVSAQTANAPSVPAPDPAWAPPPATTGQQSGPHAPPSVNQLSGRDSALTPKELQSVQLSRKWINHEEAPVVGEAGHVIYTFGTSLPSIVCAPVHVCDVELEAGETVNDINAGDPVRWKITPAFSGQGARRTTHVIVKPTDTALTTDLIITTDRRTYVLKLVSRQLDWMPVVSFSYPDDANAQWAAYKAASEQQAQASPAPVDEGLDTLDFSYELKPKGRDIDWRPVRVYTNGAKTYIEFPASVSHGDLPALVALDGKTEAVVNYRMASDRFVVDKLLRHAALIRGVGAKQQRVELTYTGKL